MDMSVDEQLKDANFELYLSNLQDFVHDDEKIVFINQFILILMYFVQI